MDRKTGGDKVRFHGVIGVISSFRVAINAALDSFQRCSSQIIIIRIRVPPFSPPLFYFKSAIYTCQRTNVYDYRQLEVRFCH